MRKSTIIQLTAGLVLAALMPLGARAQNLTMGAATPSASSAVAGGLRYTARIGYTGCAKVSKITLQQPQDPFQLKDNNDIDPSGISASAYPNPFADEIRITFPIKEQAGIPVIQLIDNTGKSAEPQFEYSENGRRGQAILRADRLPSGKYIIRILTGGCIYAVSAIKI